MKTFKGFRIDPKKVKPLPPIEGELVSIVVEKDKDTGLYVRRIKYSNGEEVVSLLR